MDNRTIGSGSDQPQSNYGHGNNSAGFLAPYKLASGSLRGTQIVGFGGVKIDGANNRITLGSTTKASGEVQEAVVGKLNANSTTDQSFGLKVFDASGAYISIGILPDGFLGIQLVDKNGNEVMRSGYLPVSGLYGWATATSGNTLEGQV